MGKDLWRKRSKRRQADTIMSDSERATGEVVKEIIERDGSIKTGLARGLINARALARYIQVATREQHSLEAIVSAIRRYPLKESFDRYQAVGEFIQKITLKNKMVHVLVQNNPGIPLILARFSEKVNYGGGETFHSVTGIETMSVVIDSKNLSKLLAVIPKSSNLKVEDGLAQIVVTLSDQADRWVGVNAVLTAQLAMNDIDIRLYFDSPHTHGAGQSTLLGSVLINILVMQRDAMKAYQALEDLSSQR